MTNEDFILLLTQKYYNSLYQYAKKICVDKNLAEDIVQETFLTAYEKADELQKHEEVLGWLYQTARYKMLHMVDHYLNYESIDDIAESESHKAGFETDSITILDLNPELCKYLNQEEVKLLLRHYEEGYKYMELAEEYHVSPDTIKTRIHRIRKRLRKNLKDYWIF